MGRAELMKTEEENEISAETECAINHYLSKSIERKLKLLAVASTAAVAIGGLSIITLTMNYSKSLAETRISKAINHYNEAIDQQMSRVERKVETLDTQCDAARNTISETKLSAREALLETLNQLSLVNERTEQLNQKLTAAESFITAVDSASGATTEIVKELTKDKFFFEKIRRHIIQQLDPLPKGTIIPFHGTEHEVRQALARGWAICDGSNGTPDLRDRFILGTGLTDIGLVGGTKAHAHAGTTKNPREKDRTAGMGGSEAARQKHTHSFETEEAQHLPPFLKVVFLIKTANTNIE